MRSPGIPGSWKTRTGGGALFLNLVTSTPIATRHFRHSRQRVADETLKIHSSSGNCSRGTSTRIDRAMPGFRSISPRFASRRTI